MDVSIVTALRGIELRNESLIMRSDKSNVL